MEPQYGNAKHIEGRHTKHITIGHNEFWGHEHHRMGFGHAFCFGVGTGKVPYTVND
jgi:hypothetical protein